MLTLLSFGANGWGDELMRGMAMTLVIAMSGFGLGLVFGTLAAIARRNRMPVLNPMARAYTLVIRGVPELLIIYLMFFAGGPYLILLGQALGFDGRIAIDALLAGILSLGLISGAYSSEIIRGALQVIPKGQYDAADALGLTDWQAFRMVIWPQLLRHALPPLGNEWMLTLKGTALISVTGLAELMRATHVAAGSTRMYFTFYLVAFLIYLLLTALSELVWRHMERRLNTPHSSRI